MENYTYQTSSKFTYIQYFKQNPLSTWNLDDFVEFFGGAQDNVKRKKLKESYIYCLNCIILQDGEVPDDIKAYIRIKKTAVSKIKLRDKIVF
jgi:hypothetical protein